MPSALSLCQVQGPYTHLIIQITSLYCLEISLKASLLRTQRFLVSPKGKQM